MLVDEDETLSHAIGFPDGMEMDIKLCGVQFEETCSDVEDNFFGE